MLNYRNISKVFTGTNKVFLNMGILLLRLTAGGILFMAGAGKVLGWFGGFGLTVTLGFYTKMGIPTPLAYLSCYTEFLGGLLLAVGLLTRPAAFAVMINMLVAFIVTLPSGFIMGNASYPFSLMISAIMILLSGPKDYSLDYFLFKTGEKPREFS